MIDLVKMKAFYFDGDDGDDVRREGDSRRATRSRAAEAREKMLDAVSMFSDELMEAILEGEPTEAQIIAAVREGALSLELTPGVHGLGLQEQGRAAAARRRDALPALARARSMNKGVDLDHDEAEIVIETDPDKPLVALAFKLDDGRYGQLTYIRVYQGTVEKGSTRS